MTWRGDAETVLVQPWGPDSVRVRSVPVGPIIDSEHALLTPARRTEVSFTRTDGLVVMTNGGLRVEMHEETVLSEVRQRPLHRCRLRFTDASGRALLEETDPGGALNLRARDFRPLAGDSFAVSASFASDPSEHLVGMGEYQQHQIDLKGTTLELMQRNSQASVPFVISSAGYGMLWNDPSIGSATFAVNRTVWESRMTRQLDYWITAGETPSQILHAYADATGHAPEFPDWAMGFWHSKLRYWNQQQIIDTARTFKERNLPLDVIVADFFHWPHMGDYRFDEEFWPDPDAMTSELKSLGTELMVSIWPQVALDSENFAEMSSRNLLVRTDRGMDAQMSFQGPSLFIDVMNPEAREFLWEMCRRNYGSHGIRMFWLDEAEPEYGVYDHSVYRHFTGPALEVGNLYPQLFARTFFEGQRRDGQTDIVNLVRCAWAGSQRYGVVLWSGDIHSTWADLANQIPIGIHLGASGIPWFTTDIGGFTGGRTEDPAFQELLVRWFQFGTFCPVMRLHGDRLPFEDVAAADGTPRLRSGAPDEPWVYGGDTTRILEHCIRLRRVLHDDVARAMGEAHDTGAPVMRGLFLEFPDDQVCWTIDDEFLLGADLLVCPVLEPGATTRRLYLPTGATWTDLRDGSLRAGGQWVETPVDLGSIPVFGRDGAGEHLLGRIQSALSDR
ncbi:MAG: family 31 glucosidase [Actinomyces sp.]|nr:family 31 glucosidase [Actinomyces sp.]